MDENYYPIADIAVPNSIMEFGNGYILFVIYCDENNIDVLDRESAKDVIDFLHKIASNTERSLSIRQGIYSSIDLIESWFGL